MKQSTISSFVLTLLILQISVCISANDADSALTETERNNIIKILSDGSEEWRTISNSLTTIKINLSDSAIAASFLKALIEESEYQKNNYGEITEERGEYYLEMISILDESYKSDAVVEALINTLGIVGGTYVPKVLAKFGDDVIPQLNERYNVLLGGEDSFDALVRSDILFTTKEIINNRIRSTNIWILSEKQYEDLIELLEMGIKDPNQSVRKWALEGLELINDQTLAGSVN